MSPLACSSLLFPDLCERLGGSQVGSVSAAGLGRPNQDVGQGEGSFWKPKILKGAGTLGIMLKGSWVAGLLGAGNLVGITVFEELMWWRSVLICCNTGILYGSISQLLYL